MQTRPSGSRRARAACTFVAWVGAALTVAACRSAAKLDSAANHDAQTAATLPRETTDAEPVATPLPEWTKHARIESNAGSYVVHVQPAPAELPDNEPFELRVWIASAARPNEVQRNVRLAVDASMPEHGHGMNRTPKIVRAEGGEFVVQGMLFHMTGRWELYFDVTAGALTERAQADVVLE